MFASTPLHGGTTPEGSGSWQRCGPFSDQWSDRESELYSLWMETPLGISSRSILPSLFLGLTLGYVLKNWNNFDPQCLTFMASVQTFRSRVMALPWNSLF